MEGAPTSSVSPISRPVVPINLVSSYSTTQGTSFAHRPNVQLGDLQSILSSRLLQGSPISNADDFNRTWHTYNAIPEVPPFHNKHIAIQYSSIHPSTKPPTR